MYAEDTLYTTEDLLNKPFAEIMRFWNWAGMGQTAWSELIKGVA